MSPDPVKEPVTVMVLGTYHFANPGLDLHNIEADDVLSAQRQAELETLATGLLEFEPTVIAVERTAPAPYTDPGWETFSPDTLSTVRNERVQIGYRLATAAGIDRVYAIDEQPEDGEPNYFPYGPLQVFAKEAGREAELEALSDWDAYTETFERMQKTESIAALLAQTNGPEFSDAFYWNAIAMGEGERQPGPELAAYWFLRNAKIMNKLAQVTKPGDRVIIVYGAGHGHWLRDMTEKMRGFELEPVLPYLERADRMSE